MVSLLQINLAIILYFQVQPITSQHPYDKNECSHMGISSYNCSIDRAPCQTFIVYGAQKNYQTLSSISSLFNLNQTQLLNLNNLSESYSTHLSPNQEILIPVTCSCYGKLSFTIFGYDSTGSDTYTSLACETFRALTKPQTLREQNPYQEGKLPGDSNVSIPIKCACPDIFDRRNRIKYLITYPVVAGDDVKKIAQMFNVSEEMIREANGLEPNPTIFSLTTLLVPVQEVPVLPLLSFPPLPSKPSPNTGAIDMTKVTSSTSSNRSLYIVLGAGGFTVTVILVITFAAILRSKRRQERNMQPLSARSSQNSNLSLDFLDGISKLRDLLFQYSLDDLKLATKDFHEDNKINCSMHHGRINGVDLAIQQISLGQANRVINILTKINHRNIVKLHGFCHSCRPYLLFEYAGHGCLLDCLLKPSLSNELTWDRRIRIAFDVSVGLHYLHCSTYPSYAHGNLRSRNVLITMDWRAKLTGLELAQSLPIAGEKEKEEDKSSNEITPEYPFYSLASSKMDIFDLGVILLEIITGKEASYGLVLQNPVRFFLEGSGERSPQCTEMLNDIVDPNLGRDYPAEAVLRLVLLAHACVEENLFQRPTMNDVLKVLSQMI
ncbi:protein LYK5-like [Aristolochia californica]|uniref:protein LYK5-like n=1 Tax=Aristolochia californica TaxID=171875 RepID=UPI0035E2F846